MLIAAVLTVAALAPSTPPPAAATPAERIAYLANHPDMRCYSVAANRRTTPLRENYMTFSPVLDQLRRGQTVFGDRVEGENKVLVHSPNAAGSIGLVRYTFMREVPMARCTGKALYAPGREELKGWGKPLTGDAALPAPNLKHPVNHYGCYERKRGGEAFWGTQMMDDSRYLPKLRPLNGENLRPIPMRSVRRVPIARCG